MKNHLRPRFIVTGCPRSGTAYIRMALKLAGLEWIRHEWWRDQGVVSWFYAGDVRMAYHGFRPNPPRRADTVLHQIREPLANIASMYTLCSNCWAYIESYTPVVQGPDILKAAQVWYYWNKLAEGRAVYSYRVEDVPRCWPNIVEHAGLPPDTPLPDVPIHMRNVRPHPPVTWADIEAVSATWCRRVQSLAETYGYPRDTQEGAGPC